VQLTKDAPFSRAYATRHRQKLDENTVLRNAGCLCCTVRGDRSRALPDLLPRVNAGEVKRVMIETTGLAFT